MKGMEVDLLWQTLQLKETEGGEKKSAVIFKFMLSTGLCRGQFIKITNIL